MLRHRSGGYNHRGRPYRRLGRRLGVGFGSRSRALSPAGCTTSAPSTQRATHASSSQVMRQYVARRASHADLSPDHSHSPAKSIKMTSAPPSASRAARGKLAQRPPRPPGAALAFGTAVAGHGLDGVGGLAVTPTPSIAARSRSSVAPLPRRAETNQPWPHLGQVAGTLPPRGGSTTAWPVRHFGQVTFTRLRLPADRGHDKGD